MTTVSTRRSPGTVGWPLVGWSTLLLVSMSVAILVVDGIGEAGLRTLIRATARTSFVLFTAAFIASALQATWPAPLSRWLLVNRRYLGVSFAVSHGIHLLAIIVLLRVAADLQISGATLIGGGLAYGFIATMTATSFDRSAAWLGARAWRRLHTAGMYYIWFIFFISYAPRAIASVVYLPFAVVQLGALGLRLAVSFRRRHRTHPRLTALSRRAG